jgi:hypothetical protein
MICIHKFVPSNTMTLCDRLITYLICTKCKLEVEVDDKDDPYDSHCQKTKDE